MSFSFYAFLSTQLTSHQVIESVLVINPGTLSKHRAAGTYANMALYPRVVEDNEREEKELGHKVYERARVDVLRI